jgi:hypothetical protein
VKLFGATTRLFKRVVSGSMLNGSPWVVNGSTRGPILPALSLGKDVMEEIARNFPQVLITQVCVIYSIHFFFFVIIKRFIRHLMSVYI